MKQGKKASKSTSRVRLYLQGNRDEETGLKFSERVFYPQDKTKPSNLIWFFMDLLIIALVVIGLFLLLQTGFSIRITWWFYLVLFVVTGYAVFICRHNASSEFVGHSGSTSSSENVRISKKRTKLILAAISAVIYIALIFALQERIVNGARIFYFQIRETLQQTYNKDATISVVVNGNVDASIFLIMIGVIVTFVIAWAIVKSESFLGLLFVLIPILAVTLLSGAGKSVLALFLLMFGLLGCFIATRTIRHKRLWGAGNKALYESNVNRFQRIQKKNVALFLAFAIVLSIPSYYFVAPLLGLKLKPAERVAYRIQNEFLSRVLAAIPDITANQWNLSVETVGGGVSDGALISKEGYELKGVDDLRITVSKKPEETIFLRGFVGSEYKDNRWISENEKTFSSSASNWRVEGNAGIYITNMSFLRTGFAFGQAAELGESIRNVMAEYDANPVQITVERINANKHYTYVPYGAYVNDYYVVNGDGAIYGQDESQDMFYFYYRDNYENILKVWNNVDSATSKLDVTEASYNVYCNQNYLTVADGLEPLRKKVEAEREKAGLSTDFDTDEIISWIRAFLAANYEYEMADRELAEGEDFLSDFLYKSGKGYSIHFATAGVELFRMFGIPARYVVGYEAPASIFAAQASGVYTATLQDDNAQAWVEIYVKNIGWMPVDVTPGVIGTLEEVGPGGEKIESYDEDEEDLILEEAGREEEVVIPEKTFSEKLTENINRVLSTDLTLAEIIEFFVIIVGCIALVVCGIICASRYCRAYGYDPFKKRSLTERLLLIYSSFYKKMVILGLSDEVDTASEEFIEFASQHVKEEKLPVGKIRELRDHIYGCCYGNEKVCEQDIIDMRGLRKSVKRGKKIVDNTVKIQ